MIEINKEAIKAINVLKGEKAIGKFGDKGRNGVLIITVSKDEWKRYAEARRNNNE